MKGTTKRLFLGSAAGLIAVAGGAQAADLPVKAKPVEYVKVCSLYGAGFWYVPGTDTCLKIGSFIREQVGWDQSSEIPTGFNQAGGQFTRTDTSDLGFRTRVAMSVDLRSQTEYGVLRSYFEGGFETNGSTGGAPGNDVVYTDRGFIQFAGLTVGRIRSVFDINTPYLFAYMTQLTNADSGTFRGLWGISYTAEFGNGLSATISFEDGGSSSQGNNAGTIRGRGHHDVNLSMASQLGLGTTSYDNEGWKFPDVVGAVHIEQTWGYAQLSAALHDASGGYYTAATGDACGANAFCQNLGHPGDAYGWAVSGGFLLNDFLGQKGDQFAVQATYSLGASGYVTSVPGSLQVYGSGNAAAFGWATDGVFTTGSSVELTTSWGVNAGYQHFWNPKWRTSLYGGYVEFDYDSTATAMFCATPTAPAGVAMTAVTNCSPSYSFWQVGSRTQWNPNPNLDIGVDVVWSHLNTAFAGTATLAANGARPAGIYNISDQDVLSVLFRVQRNFLP
jgi:hypothetical protein